MTDDYWEPWVTPYYCVGYDAGYEPLSFQVYAAEPEHALMAMAVHMTWIGRVQEEEEQF